MKTTNPQFRALKTMFVAAVCTIMFAFTPYVGGDTFEISLGDKTLIEQFVHHDKSVKTITLTESSANEMLSVRYSHCGVVGNARSLALKNSDNTIIKSWNFADADKGTFPPMTCKVRDILAAAKGQKVSLVYTAKELPESKTLVTIVTSDVKASLNR
ncbi:MAG TPA: hypothetical protein VEB86_17560 [Chryseosolibacter sp.]|nr:hypothetical protein [Chryseosolibacter sp.]